MKALIAASLALALAVSACDSSTDSAGSSGGSSGTALDGPWIVNTEERSTEIFASGASSTGVLYDVQVAELRSVDGGEYTYVEATGIPKYDVVVTQDISDALIGRPRAAIDFVAAAPSVSVGQTVVFGQDIGYASSTSNCNDTGGYGYWPPGPECPLDTAKTQYFAAEPVAASESCETGLGIIGLLVNGTSVFNWGDGQSYGNGVWYNLAPVAEQYDVDICGGHAAMGEYHHHFYTQCLADLVGDRGDAHSPIYGYASDGYPIYGPWEADGQLALSGWHVRDYGASAADGGCGTPGLRSCILNDNSDLSAGVNSSVTAGPALGASVTTLSGNTLSATAGYYFEDYYYAGTAVGGAQLDEHNGHDTGDGRGYHYHITLERDADDILQPRFPYTIGPEFAGTLPANAATQCNAGASGGGGPGGGPPGGGPPPPGA